MNGQLVVDESYKLHSIRAIQSILAHVLFCVLDNESLHELFFLLSIARHLLLEDWNDQGLCLVERDAVGGSRFAHAD